MITFEKGLDVRTREVPSQVARFAMGDGTYRYICIGTDYGHIHTTSGDVRTWGTYGSARRFLNNYLKERED